MLLNQNFISAISNGGSINYLFTFSFANFSMRLSTSDIEIIYNNCIYYSGIEANNLTFANLSKTNDVEIRMANKYCDQKVSVEELLQAKVEIQLAILETGGTIFVEKIWRGFVSKVVADNGTLAITITPSMLKLNQSIGELYSPICRACFGSAQCGVNVEHYKAYGKISTILSSDCFSGTHDNNKTMPSGYYRYGLLKMTSGKLAGLCLQIKDEKNGDVYLLKATNLLSVGDEYVIFAGCDKTLTTCKNKFNNVVNFRGEPFI